MSVDNKNNNSIKYSIDYSKWDKLEVSSDDGCDSDDGDEFINDSNSTDNTSDVIQYNGQHKTGPHTQSQPRVTKFDAPQRVTIGGTCAGTAGDNATTLFVGGDDPTSTLDSSSSPATSSTPQQQQSVIAQQQQPVHPLKRSKAFSTLDMELWSANGGVCAEYAWRQERFTVDFLLLLPRYIASTGAPLVKCVDVMNHEQRSIFYEEVTAKKLSVELKDYGQKLQIECKRNKGDSVTLLLLDLKFEVKDDEDEWIWELVRVKKQDSTLLHPFGPRGVQAVETGKRSVALRPDWHDAVLYPQPSCTCVAASCASTTVNDSSNSDAPTGSSVATAGALHCPNTDAACSNADDCPNTDAACGKVDDWLLLSVFMKKVVKIPGLTVWWKAAFLGEDETELAAMKSRNSADVQAAAQFEANWNEAHKCFLEKHNKKSKS
eukprot:Lankesteria_metandrocarpae@DN4950_c0_g1_i3.p1